MLLVVELSFNMQMIPGRHSAWAQSTSACSACQQCMVNDEWQPMPCCNIATYYPLISFMQTGDCAAPCSSRVPRGSTSSLFVARHCWLHPAPCETAWQTSRLLRLVAELAPMHARTMHSEPSSNKHLTHFRKPLLQHTSDSRPAVRVNMKQSQDLCRCWNVQAIPSTLQ